MILTAKQNAVLDKLERFSFERPFFLGGYAGTGKTTILKALEQMYPGKVTFLAPTGKACQVLKTKMSPTAKVRTIHSFLYLPVEVTEETVARWRSEAENGSQYAKTKLKNYEDGFTVDFMDNLTEPVDDIVVVDESSMLGQREYLRLREVCRRLVFVGDTFQLPPVQSPSVIPSEAQDFDAFLDEVHRAALESPITRLSMDIRSGNFKGWKYWSQNGIEYSVKTTLGTLRSVDQVITGSNAERKRLNRAMRLPERGYEPHVGDKVIVKDNIYGRNKSLRLVNGDIGRISSLQMSFGGISIEGIPGHLYPEHLRFTDELLADCYGVEASLPREMKGAYRNHRIDYAYAITCHASQGSEWPSVLVYDDHMRASDKESRLRWLYTAVTRAKEKLIFVEKSC